MRKILSYTITLVILAVVFATAGITSFAHSSQHYDTKLFNKTDSPVKLFDFSMTGKNEYRYSVSYSADSGQITVLREPEKEKPDADPEDMNPNNYIKNCEIDVTDEIGFSLITYDKKIAITKDSDSETEIKIFEIRPDDTATTLKVSMSEFSQLIDVLGMSETLSDNASTSDVSTNDVASSEAPTSEAPTSEAPTSEAPTSEAPTSETAAEEVFKPEAEKHRKPDLMLIFIVAAVAVLAILIICLIRSNKRIESENDYPAPPHNDESENEQPNKYDGEYTYNKEQYYIKDREVRKCKGKKPVEIIGHVDNKGIILKGETPIGCILNNELFIYEDKTSGEDTNSVKANGSIEEERINIHQAKEPAAPAEESAPPANVKKELSYQEKVEKLRNSIFEAYKTGTPFSFRCRYMFYDPSESQLQGCPVLQITEDDKSAFVCFKNSNGKIFILPNPVIYSEKSIRIPFAGTTLARCISIEGDENNANRKLISFEPTIVSESGGFFVMDSPGYIEWN